MRGPWGSFLPVSYTHLDTDYGPNNDGVTDYNDTDYGPNNDGITDYNDTDYGPNNDGVTDYNDTDYGPNNDGVTDYNDTNYDDHGNTNYGDTNYDDGGSDYDREADDDWDDGCLLYTSRQYLQDQHIKGDGKENI